MEIKIKEAQTKKDFKQFVLFPFSIYKTNTNWVPPLIRDELKVLDPNINPAFDCCASKFWIAFKNKKCVGRIGVVINKDYNKKTNQKMARFMRFECENDQHVADRLLQTAEDWARKNNIKKKHVQ